MNGNTAMDHSEALEEARNRDSQMPNAQQTHPGDLHMHGAADNYSGAPSSGRADNYSQNSQDGDHVGNLADARKGGLIENMKAAKELSKMATPMGAFSLLKQINFIGDMPYVAALGAALLKDILDFLAAETIVLSIVFSILCTIFIFMMMLLVGANSKKRGVGKFLSKLGILGAGGIADSIPGIDFLPIETITVAVVYMMELAERKMAEKK